MENEVLVIHSKFLFDGVWVFFCFSVYARISRIEDDSACIFLRPMSSCYVFVGGICVFFIVRDIVEGLCMPLTSSSQDSNLYP